MTEKQVYEVVRIYLQFELRRYPCHVVAEVVVRAPFESETIVMTSPVVQGETQEGEYAVGFVLPATFTLESAPVPTNPEVTLHARPTALAAVRRYRGRWTHASFDRHRAVLDRAVRDAGLTPVGPPRWARFDPPIVPAPLRRNEIVQDVSA